MLNGVYALTYERIFLAKGRAVLFNSSSFLFFFLPLFILCAKLAAVGGPKGSSRLFLLFSLIFYASWNAPALFLLVGTLAINYAFACQLCRQENETSVSRRNLLILALILNLLPLLYAKYSGFFAETIQSLLGVSFTFEAPALPPGISFYTFIQIAWLVSVYRREVTPAGLERHTVFSTFFPYILSGPIVRYQEMGPQLDQVRAPNAQSLALGLSLFAIGLGKKVLLADSLALSANAVFGAAEKAWPLTGAEAWLGSLSYSFQLYFDFSGYTDMAIGLGLMLGLQLPENFISPYKATGIVDFWRRWHITLGLWLRDFLYIPLGGNRHGKLKQYRNLFLTMLIGGAWHGAGWTFIIWGAMHGLMLCINHFFRAQIKGRTWAGIFERLPVRVAFICLTFFCLNLAWVVFRAQSLEGAWRVYSAMFAQPLAATGAAGDLQGFFPHHYFQDWTDFALLALSAFIIWALPASHEITSRRQDTTCWLRFSLTRSWAVCLSLLFLLSLLMLTRQSAFLYFQF